MMKFARNGKFMEFNSWFKNIWVGMVKSQKGIYEFSYFLHAETNQGKLKLF